MTKQEKEEADKRVSKALLSARLSQEVPVDVSYHNRDIAKMYGGRWDFFRRKWIMPNRKAADQVKMEIAKRM